MDESEARKKYRNAVAGVEIAAIEARATTNRRLESQTPERCQRRG